MFPRSVDEHKFLMLLDLVDRFRVQVIDTLLKLASDRPMFKDVLDEITQGVDDIFQNYIRRLTALDSERQRPNKWYPYDHFRLSVEPIFLCAEFNRTYEYRPSQKRFVNSSLVNKVVESIENATINFYRSNGKIDPIDDLMEGVRDAIDLIVDASEQEYRGVFGTEDFSPKALIVTALDHEFHGVLRRLDEVYAVSGDKNFGCRWDIVKPENGAVSKFDTSDPFLKIRDRKHRGHRGNTEGDPINSTTRELEWKTGWVLGKLSGKKVAVICVGAFGSYTTSNSIAAFLHFRPNNSTRARLQRPSHWLLVGVCGATSPEVPLGDLVLSKTAAYYCEKGAEAGSNTPSWRFLKCMNVNGLLNNVPDVLVVPKELLFIERPPFAFQGVQLVAGNVRVHKQRFLCTNRVVKGRDDKSALLKSLSTKAKKLKENTGFAWNTYSCKVDQLSLDNERWFGIEMERAGMERDDVAIIKSVVDHADKNKAEEGWSENDILLIQFYAADIAGHALSVLLPNVVDNRKQ